MIKSVLQALIMPVVFIRRDSYKILHPVQAIQSFVRQSMAYIPQTPDKETRIELIKTLQTVTEGKVSHPYWPLTFTPSAVINATCLRFGLGVSGWGTGGDACTREMPMQQGFWHLPNAATAAIFSLSSMNRQNTLVALLTITREPYDVELACRSLWR